MLGPGIDVDELEGSLTTTRRAALEAAAEELREGGLRVTTDVLRGTPFVEIIREVQRGGHDLLVKTAGEEGGLSSVLFGSVDMHLLRKCPCPVWLLQPDTRLSFKRILASVDAAAEAAEGRSLNRLILELSTSLAAVYGSELHVAHCWRVPGASLLERRVSAAELDRYRSQVISRTAALFGELLADFSAQVPPERRHLLEGDPGAKLARFARDREIDLVVMGTVARSGVPGLLIGNTAEKLIPQLRCSVLTAKPEGFVSPVVVPT